jgi:hypothetical protein
MPDDEVARNLAGMDELDFKGRVCLPTFTPTMSW